MAYPRLVTDLLPVGLRGLVLAGLIAILTSSMSACYNASATVVVRDFFLRWKPGLSDREQVAIGRRVTVLMAALGEVAAPLVGLSVTIWHYLQMLSAYLSVPLGAVIFHRLAVETPEHGRGDFRRHGRVRPRRVPVPRSGPRLAAITMIVVSLLTAPAPEYKTEGNMFASGAGQSLEGTDYRIWAGVLFVCTPILWRTFR